jgi:hypothetical protein
MNAVPAGGTPPTFISLVSVALVNEDLHVCAIDANGGGKLYHTIRLADGTWAQPFEEVKPVVLAQNPGSFDPGLFYSVACAAVFGELHLMIMASLPSTPGSGPPYYLLHTIRHADGTWGPFVDVVQVFQQLGWNPPPGVLPAVNTTLGLAELDGHLHLCFPWVLNGPPYGITVLFHVIHLSFGGWTIPEDVLATVNSLHPGTWIPKVWGRSTTVAAYGGIHVCFDTYDPGRLLAHSTWFSSSESWSPFDDTTSEFFWYHNRFTRWGFTLNPLTNLTKLAMTGSG